MYLPPILTKKVVSFAWLQETVTSFAMVWPWGSWISKVARLA